MDLEKRKPGRPAGSRNRATIRRAATVLKLEREDVISVRKAFTNLARIAEGSDSAAVAANKLILDRLLGKVADRLQVEGESRSFVHILTEIVSSPAYARALEARREPSAIDAGVKSTGSSEPTPRD